MGNIIIQSTVSTNPCELAKARFNHKKGYLPGFYAGIPLADAVGRVRQQLFTSVAVCILYAIWAGISDPGLHTSVAGLMVIFGLSQFVICMGPNCTTFLIPCEVFPTRVRGSAHGISAAIGKSGAVITAFAFGTITQKIGLPGVLGLFSGLMGLTAAVTLMIPESGNKSLADIERGLSGGKFRSILAGKRLHESEVPVPSTTELPAKDDVDKDAKIDMKISV